MGEASGLRRGRWAFRLAGVGVLALVLALAARTSPGTANKSVLITGAHPRHRAPATTSCAQEDVTEQAEQTAVYNARHAEDVAEDANPPADPRAEDVAEHNAYVAYHRAETAEDLAEGTGYGACTDSVADVAVPAG